MAKRLFLSLNQRERDILQEVAVLKGYKDFRTLIHRKIHALPADIKRDSICDKGDFKKVNSIPINDELEIFLTRLSCQHGTDNLGAIVYRYIIYPEIKEWMTS